jgi:hypothetical protein
MTPGSDNYTAKNAAVKGPMKTVAPFVTIVERGKSKIENITQTSSGKCTKSALNIY